MIPLEPRGQVKFFVSMCQIHRHSLCMTYINSENKIDLSDCNQKKFACWRYIFRLLLTEFWMCDILIFLIIVLYCRQKMQAITTKKNLKTSRKKPDNVKFCCKNKRKRVVDNSPKLKNGSSNRKHTLIWL